mgnify:CR=1 FL=1
MSDASTQTKLLGDILSQLKHNATRGGGGSMPSGQADTLKKMADMLNGVNIALNSMDASSKNVVGSLSHATAMMETYGGVLGTVGLTFQQINKLSGGILEKVAKMTGLKKIWTSIHGTIGGIVKSTKNWQAELKKADTRLKKAYATANLLTSVLGGLVKTTFQLGAGFLSVGKTIMTSVVGAFTSAMTAAAKFAKFVYTLPIGIANRAADIGNQVRKEFKEVIGQAIQDSREYFDALSDGGGALSSLGGMLKSNILLFEDVDNSLLKLFGTGAGGVAKGIGEAAKGMNDMGLFFDIFSASMKNGLDPLKFFVTMTRGLGMGAEEVNYVMREAIANGEHYQVTMTRIYEASDSASTQFGVDRKRLSKNYFQLRKDITNFGHLSEIELMRVTARATQMGVEIKDLAGVFNKFGTFEDAANSAALLSQTFGMNIDALQLLRAEDPMQVVDMFRHAMMATGRSFNMLNRHEKSLMATHTGMSVESLKTVMNYRNMGKSFKQIKKIMENQKPEVKQLKAMRAINDSVIQLQKTIDKKDFFKAFLDGVSKVIAYNTDLGESYRNLGKRMEKFFIQGLKTNKTQLNRIFKPFTEILDSIKDIFSLKDLKNISSIALENVAQFVEQVLDPEACMYPLVINQKWNSAMESLFDLEKLTNDKTFFGKLAKQTGKIMGYIVRIFTAIGPGLVKGIGDSIITALDFLSGRGLEKGAKDRIAKFLFPDDKQCREALMSAFEDAVKTIKNYIFGKDEKDGFRKGFLHRLIHGTTDAVKDATRKGGPLSQAVEGTGGILNHMFRSLGKSIIDGMKDAGDALVSVGEMLGRGVLRAMGLDFTRKTKQGLHNSIIGAPESMNKDSPLKGIADVIQATAQGGPISGFVKSIEKANDGLISFGNWLSESDSLWIALSGGIIKLLGNIAKWTASSLFGKDKKDYENREALERDIKSKASGFDVHEAKTLAVNTGVKTASYADVLLKGLKGMKVGGFRNPFTNVALNALDYHTSVEDATHVISEMTKYKKMTESEMQDAIDFMSDSQLNVSAQKAVLGSVGFGSGFAATGAATIGLEAIPGIGTALHALTATAGGILAQLATEKSVDALSKDAYEAVEAYFVAKDDIGKLQMNQNIFSKDTLDEQSSALRQAALADSDANLSLQEIQNIVTAVINDPNSETKALYREVMGMFKQQKETIELNIDGEIFARVMTNRMVDMVNNPSLNTTGYSLTGYKDGRALKTYKR